MLFASFHRLVAAHRHPLLYLSYPSYSCRYTSRYRRLLSVDRTVMDSSAPIVLYLSGRTAAEMEVAESMVIRGDCLRLPDDGEVKLVLNSDVERQCSKKTFNVDEFLKRLSTKQFGRFVAWSPRLPSTHDVVSHNFSELPIGTVCVADLQYKGRGRSKNVWASPVGCLLFSFTIQMDDGRIVPLLQYVISLAITEAVKEICDKNGLPYLDLRIKWPNDIYLNGLKVGGILCTSSYKSKKFNVSAGIGLNVHNNEPTICLNKVLRELSHSSYEFSREEMLGAFFNKFEELYDKFIHEGFQTLEELYYRTWLHSGQRVIVQDKSEGQVIENVVTIQGLTPSGYLLAFGDDGQLSELHPDGNSFDFFKGLVRRKFDG
ncbi:hypothetical protein MLD38_000431 [Melastoma candidum]|uniref:Uncharacterized protein n=1 Tax=Melastoma candidum TaxID=119954 RepID=A0ACB9SC04_9MYRT|nr:hypothetical protein MLD38_000431 [Melastoma candidum]